MREDEQTNDRKDDEERASKRTVKEQTIQDKRQEKEKVRSEHALALTTRRREEDSTRQVESEYETAARGDRRCHCDALPQKLRMDEHELLCATPLHGDHAEEIRFRSVK